MRRSVRRGWTLLRSRFAPAERRAVQAVQARLAEVCVEPDDAAIFDQTMVDITAKAERTYDFRVTGSVLKFDGSRGCGGWIGGHDPAGADGGADAGEDCGEFGAEVYAAAAAVQRSELVKTLEERGIGRPSTYASIINTIQDATYVKKIDKKFVPTEIGTVVTGCW